MTRKQPSQQQQQLSGSHDSHSSGLSANAPFLLRQLKGHSDECTAIAFGAAAPRRLHAVVAVGSRDRLVRVWQLDEADSARSEVVSVKMRFDYATALCFGAGDSELYCVMSDTNSVDVYSLSAAAADKLTVAFSRSFATAARDAVTAAHCTPHRLLLLMSRGTDSPVLVYSAASGQLLRSLSLNQLRNHDLAASSDGRVFAAATKLSDVKLWTVNADRAGAVTAIEHRLTLSGHSKAVQALCFPSSELACTISADTLRCYNIGVRYADGEEPKLRWAVPIQLQTEAIALRASSASSSSSASWLLAVATVSEVRVYRASYDGCTELQVLSGVGGQWGLAGMELRADGKRLVTLNVASKTAYLWKLPDE